MLVAAKVLASAECPQGHSKGERLRGEQGQDVHITALSLSVLAAVSSLLCSVAWRLPPAAGERSGAVLAQLGASGNSTNTGLSLPDFPSPLS